MDFRYKSELNEFFIRRENLEQISRIKINQEDNEKNSILTPILMKYGKIFYLVFQILNKGIYGIEILPDNKYGSPFLIMKMETDQKFFKLVKCVSKNESDDKAGLLIEEPTGDIELNLLTVDKRCRISLRSTEVVYRFDNFEPKKCFIMMDNENNSWLLIGSTNQNTLFCQSPINKTSTTHIDISDIDVIGCHYSWRLVSFILLCVSNDNRFMLFKIDSDLDSKTAFPVLYRTWYSDWSLSISPNPFKSNHIYNLEFKTSQDEFVISSSKPECIILALDNENLKTTLLSKLPFMPSIFPINEKLGQLHVIQSSDWTKLERIDYPKTNTSGQISGRDSGEDKIEQLFEKLARLKETSKNLQNELKIENDFFKVISDLSQRSFQNEMPLFLEISILTFDSYSNIWSVHLSSTSGGTSGLDPFGYRLKFCLNKNESSQDAKISKIKFFTEPKFIIPKNLDLVWSEVIFGTSQTSSISIQVQFRILA